MLTKEECLFVAGKAETYINSRWDWWVLESCPMPDMEKGVPDFIAHLQKEALREYG